MLSMQEELQPLRPNNCVRETFILSSVQFLTWNLKTMKKNLAFLVHFCEVWNIWKVSE